MKLYSIRDKISNKFLNSVHPITDAYWSKTPKYWSTVDGINSSLKRLCGEKITPVTDFESWWNDGAKDAEIRANGYHVYWDNFDPEKLKSIEVIVIDVHLIGAASHPATDFIDAEQFA